ncbi:MAG TPA: class I SAM-dependent methyltransferase [Rhodothermales bacterium]|nr:class I SAM-dependent methyltransferase [Rhodothermales bacterium]
MNHSRESRACPCCGSADVKIAVPRDVIARESDIRTAFARRRANGTTGRQDLKDRASFTHDEAVDLLECRRCGLLIRGDLDRDFTAVYARDHYDRAVLEHFLQRDIRFFSHKRADYAPLLEKGARVVEVGSYAGGFLHAAKAWGWDVLGIDVGEDVAAFANEKGYPTLRGTLESCQFPASSVDGVFIWNCFDQLPDPNEALEEVRRILKPGGLLLIRVPNALFYRLCQPILRFASEDSEIDPSEQMITKIMGYNNLLGFPYQYGYAPPNLRHIVERHGFAMERLTPSHLMMLPEAEAPGWALKEQHRTMQLLASIKDALSAVQEDALAGPWIELLARKPGT